MASKSKLASARANEKVQSSRLDKNLKSATEPLKCTGKFKEDFELMCSSKNTLKYVPEVIARSKRPGSAAQNNSNSSMPLETSLGKADGKKTSNQPKGKQTVATVEVDETEINIEVTELPPKSFVIKESLEYFKPKIHVEMDNPDKQDTVTEIHVKGWKIEKPLIEVLGQCLPAMDQLITLNLWNVGLDEEAVRLISAMLPNCINLKNLLLDNNPIPGPIYEVLLYEENSNVQNLSLRNNQLDDVAAQNLSFGLGDIRRQNSKILTLNLSCNQISDTGALCFARALRTNRTLLSLNLAQNCITDAGAKALSDVISRFKLSFEELVHRRYVMSGRSFDKSASPSGRKNLHTSQERPASQKSSTLGVDSKSKSKDKSANKKSNDSGSNVGGTNSSLSGTIKNSKESKGKKDEKQLGRKVSITDSKKGPKAPKSGKRQAKDQEEVNDWDEANGRNSAHFKNSALLELSALTDHVEYIEENLWLVGNRTILSINLARNELTDQSINNFLMSLQYQKSIMEVHKSLNTGLMRLVLNYNNFSSDSETNMTKLNEILKSRDPQTKAASSYLNPDPDTVSVQSGKESSLGRTMTKSRIER